MAREGNISSEPFFADTLFHLSDSSTCIGLGTESIEINGTTYSAPDHDFDGEPRPHPIDQWVDIGADESPYPKVIVGIAANEPGKPMNFALQQNYPNPFI